MNQVTLRNLLIASIIFLVTAGGAAFMVFEILTKQVVLEGQITTLAAQNKQEASLLRLQRIAQESAEDRETLKSYFLLRESDSISFLTDIESKLAPGMGVALFTEELERVTEGKTEWIQFTFKATGSRTQVEDFIAALENVPYVVKLTEVDMGVRSTEYWQATIDLRVQLLEYDQ